MQIRLLFLSLLLITKSAFALSYVCPGSYQTIMSDYTMAQVEAACGKPATVVSQDVAQNTPLQFEQWVYALPNPKNNLAPTAPQLMVTFKDDQVIEINMSNQTAAIIFPCFNSGRLAVGISKSVVRQQCGSPTSINMIRRADNQTTQMVQWTYNYGRYQPQVVITFKDGKVIDIRNGQMGN